MIKSTDIFPQGKGSQLDADKLDGKHYNDIVVAVLEQVKTIIPTTATVPIAATAQQLFNLLYPIGSLFFSRTSTNPRIILGFGTWRQIGQFELVGSDGWLGYTVQLYIFERTT